MYSMLLLCKFFISIKVIDAVSYGTSRGNGKLMFVISDNYEEVSANIMKNLKRGVTYLNGEGAYSGKAKIGNLKKFSETVGYLESKQLRTTEDLDDATELHAGTD